MQQLDATTLAAATARNCELERSTNTCLTGTNAIMARIADGLLRVTQPAGGATRNYCADPSSGRPLAPIRLPRPGQDDLLALGPQQIFYAAPSRTGSYLRQAPIPAGGRLAEPPASFREQVSIRVINVRHSGQERVGEDGDDERCVGNIQEGRVHEDLHVNRSRPPPASYLQGLPAAGRSRRGPGGGRMSCTGRGRGAARCWRCCGHLEQAVFAGAPRVIGSGLSPDGREMVSYVPGTSPHPDAWDEDAVAGVGTLLASLHAAAATFVLPPGAVWRPWFGRELLGSAPVIGHGDTGPWNIVARDGRPAALIDFEFAGPVGAEWDLAQAAWLNAQLHDDIADRLGLPDLAARGRQLRLILDGYGLPARQRGGFTDKMITMAVHSARAEAAGAQLTPQTTTGVTGTGYPFAWAIAWRVRSASWMLTHRTFLQRAIS